jgi:uncharacterized protein
MNKEQIKQKIKLAIEKDPNKDAIIKVSLFGSYINGMQRDDSDVDVIIEFRPNSGIGFFKFFDTRNNFEQHVGKKIDLLTPQALSKYFRDKVLAEAETIYER